MSDIEFSASDSEPVSDVNPDEMAKLMADLDDLDDGLSKGKPKPVTMQKQDKDSNPRVTFDNKSSPSSSKHKAANGDDDDWDADDLLYSDDESRKSKPPQKTSSQGRAQSSSTSVTSPTINKSESEHSVKKTKSKSQLMADLFNDESPKKDSSKKGNITLSEGSKKDKSKLMSDLFGEGDMHEDSITKESPGKKTVLSSALRQGSAVKRTKDEVTFDDDDDILGSIGETKPKSKAVSNSPKSSGFLDSLLGKSSTTETAKGKKERSSDFVLDEKYKNMSKETKEDLGLGGYLPSSNKSESPHRRTPKKRVSDDPFDFLDNPEPRRRNARSATQQKTFEIDDDDILGNIKSRRGKSKENKDPPQSRSSSAKNPSSSKARDEDWLFGTSGSANNTTKKEMDQSLVEASIDHETAEGKSGSPEKSQDWLGNLLSGSKKSPTKPPQSSSNANSPSMKQSSPAQSNKSPTAHLAHGDYHNVEPSKIAMPDRSPVASVVPNAQMQKTSKINEKELESQMHLTENQTSEAAIQMKAYQEQLLQQQEAKLNALSQMKAQQEELEARMAQQLVQQQEDYVKLQESALKKYQGAMTSAIGGFSLIPSIQESKPDESLKEIEVQLRSAEVNAARLAAELDLIRRQHSDELAIVEESYMKRHQMEKDVWERTEQRLREELKNISSDFQAKMAVVQAEKEALVGSHEIQVANIKKEWSHVVDRTKQLYSEMAEKMKEEHSAALERMRYLKDLELNAAISASGHVKEVEAVMLQLESNTTDLTDLTATINTRHESALDITQRALKLKEKQLKEAEAYLEASRAEAESERGRLNVLIVRLESTLMQQGSEVEQDRWRLSQEQMKTEMERKALTEERKHFQFSMQTERQNLATARESLMSEHKMMLQSIAQEKKELASQRTYLLAHEKVNQFPPFNQTSKYNQVELDAEMKFLNDEHRRLQEKMSALVYREKRLDEEEERLNELNSKMEQEKAKNAVLKEYLDQEKLSLKKMQEEVESQRKNHHGMRGEQQIRLSQIASHTQALHTQQEKLQREQQRLDHIRNEVPRLLQLGQCPTCKSQGILAFPPESAVQHSIGRLPGDGGEGLTSFNKLEISPAVNMSPKSVLARLAAARQHENVEREKRLLQLSALESS